MPPSLWGDKKQNSGGGLWYPPSFDGKGSMYFGTGNPAPFPGTPSDPWGKSRPGSNLYTNSVVKLDAKTGKMDWFYQQTPHDLYDWDFQNPPVLITAGGRELAIGSGKSGFVTALDAKTGKPVWSTPVGRHNGRDDDGLLAMRGEYSKLKGGLVYPGYLGGVIAPIAANETTVFVPIVNSPVTVTGGVELAGAEGSGPAGELVALDVASGKEIWDAEFEGPAYGAPTVVKRSRLRDQLRRPGARIRRQDRRRGLAGAAPGRHQQRRDGQRRHPDRPGRPAAGRRPAGADCRLPAWWR